MIYEIINPSDAVTIEAEHPIIACVATLMIGEGQYGLRDEGGANVMPLFLFTGAEKVDAWLVAQEGGMPLKQILDTRLKEVVDCLLTARVCSIQERKDLRPLAEDEVDAFNDKQRSSMNDIAGYARSVGRHLRRKEDKP